MPIRGQAGRQRQRYGNGDKAGWNYKKIFFENGRANGYGMSQADTGRFRLKKESELHIIHIGKEPNEIADAVIFGG